MHKINRSLKKKVVTKQKAELLKKWEKDLFFLQGSSYSPAELNPSTINHPASTSSFTMSGIAKRFHWRFLSGACFTVYNVRACPAT